jgi:tetratricopeptide (TPR) repeat protein
VSSADLLRRGIEAAHADRRIEARKIFMQVVEVDPRNELAWMWLSGLVDDLEDQIIACENVLAINPENQKVRLFLEGLKRKQQTMKGENQELLQREHAKQNTQQVKSRNSVKRKLVTRDPMRMAEFMEQDGKFDQALEIYKVEAAKAKDLHVFDQIYKNIIRIEKRLGEKIKFVPPRLSVFRLTLPWPLLYLSLALVQVGLRPLDHLASYLWFAFPWVVLGGFLVAVSEVRYRHMIWRKVFQEHGDGSLIARIVVGTAGWLMIVIPLTMLLIDSLNRLSVFQIPPRFFR